jgi:hypothetical protein
MQTGNGKVSEPEKSHLDIRSGDEVGKLSESKKGGTIENARVDIPSVDIVKVSESKKACAEPSQEWGQYTHDLAKTLIRPCATVMKTVLSRSDTHLKCPLTCFIISSAYYWWKPIPTVYVFYCSRKIYWGHLCFQIPLSIPQKETPFTLGQIIKLVFLFKDSLL